MRKKKPSYEVDLKSFHLWEPDFEIITHDSRVEES